MYTEKLKDKKSFNTDYYWVIELWNIFFSSHLYFLVFSHITDTLKDSFIYYFIYKVIEDSYLC